MLCYNSSAVLLLFQPNYCITQESYQFVLKLNMSYKPQSFILRIYELKIYLSVVIR